MKNPKDILSALHAAGSIKKRGRPLKVIPEVVKEEPKKKLIVKNSKKDNEQIPTNVTNIEEQRELRDSTRKLALGYGPEMIGTLVGLSKNARSETVRMEAAYKVLTFGGGRPPIINSNDMGTGNVMPRFIINFGEKQPETITMTLDDEDNS